MAPRKTITSSGLQAAVRAADPASHSVVDVPCAMSIRLSFPSTKKPRNLASGDQNGPTARSVPGRDRAVNVSSERIHSKDWPPDPSVFLADNATSRPSGDTERPPVVTHPAGGATAK